MNDENSQLTKELISLKSKNQVLKSFNEKQDSKISNLESNISNLNTKNSNLDSEISNLKAKVSNVSSDVSNLNTVNANLGSDISNLKAKDSKLASDISNLQSKDSNFDAEVSNLKAKDAKLASEITNLANDVEHLYSCPSDWVDGGKLGCYHVATNSSTMSYFDAKKLCQSLDYRAHLAEIRTLEIQKFVESLDLSGHCCWWIGLSDQEKVGKFWSYLG